MERKVVIRTIVMVGAPKWVDQGLEKAALREGQVRDFGGGQIIELRRQVSYLEPTVSPEEAIAEIEEAQRPAPSSQGPHEPITTEVPPEGQES